MTEKSVVATYIFPVLSKKNGLNWLLSTQIKAFKFKREFGFVDLTPSIGADRGFQK